MKATPSKKNPVISVCIPTFKRPVLLTEAIESVLNNGLKNIEIIVSDDDCDPKIKTLIKNFKDTRIHYFAHKEKGIQKNWTNAVKHAKGKYVLKLDDDDIILPGFLEESVALLNKNTQVSIVFTAYTIRYHNGRLKDVIDNNFFKQSVTQGFHYARSFLLNEARPLNHKSAGVFRKAAAKKLQYFNKLGADVFFTIGMASLGDIGYIHKPLFLYRYHSKVTQGMSYSDLSLCFSSMDTLFEYPWIKSNPEWTSIKTKSLETLKLIIPLMYIGNHRSRFGRKAAKKTKLQIMHDFPEVNQNKLFKPLTLMASLLPGFIYHRSLKFYTKYKWPKKLFNVFNRSKKK